MDKTIESKNVEPREITDELRDSYLDYAMSVIVSRALPDVRDGLKPVQRRILWAMWEEGLKANAKLRKSATVVGTVLGRYHPHGDMAVYDALARMAQDFSLRYTLVDGQGNWGSLDGDPPAAMRYTEAKLSKIAEELLIDIDKETVDWHANYDGSREEPKFLPAKLPNLLINGTVGIAVGMATSIPPHNLTEVINATTHLIDHPDASSKELLKFVPGPDFPTGGVIYDASAIETAYTTGKGSVTARGVIEVEEGKRGSHQLLISEIPYQVNKADLITKMAELVQSKKIEGIKDIRDESNREGIRIVIDLSSSSVPQKVVNQLYEYTELQKNFYFNMLALVDGLQPQVLSLKEVLKHYLDHRTNVIRRRTAFDLKRAEERAHILEGLIIALHSIDKVIATIKKSKDRGNAEANLIKQFKLTVIQANAILEMRLQSLVHLEQKKLEDELVEKKKLIAHLSLILKHPSKIAGLIKEELIEIKQNFGDERKTKLIQSGLKEFKEEDLIPEEDVILTLSRDGYIKRMLPTSFKAQARGGKGLIGFELKEEDQIQELITAHSHDRVLFFTDRGRVFQTEAYEIPAAARTARGKSIHNFLTLPAEEKVSAIVSYPKIKAPSFLVMATTNGLVKRSQVKDFSNVRRTGIIAINLKKDDSLRWVKTSSGEDEIMLVSAKGLSIRFKEREARPMSRTASGVRGMQIGRGDYIAGLDIIRKGEAAPKEQRLLVLMSKGFGKQTSLKEYKLQRRGGKGLRSAKVTEKTGEVISAHVVGVGTEEVLAFSKKGQALRTKLSEVRLAGRSTQGVRIINLETGDTLIGIVTL